MDIEITDALLEEKLNLALAEKVRVYKAYAEQATKFDYDKHNKLSKDLDTINIDDADTPEKKENLYNRLCSIIFEFSSFDK